MRVTTATLLTWLCLLFSQSASAQIFEIELKDEKTAQKYKKQMVEIDGQLHLYAEIRKGITWSRSAGGKWDPRVRSEWYLPNPKDPLSLPYKLKDGRVTKAVKKQVLGLSNADLVKIWPVVENGSWSSIARDYQRRLDIIEALEEKRDELPKGEVDWQRVQWEMLSEMEVTVAWLRSLGFGPAADKLEKNVVKQRKVVSLEAAEERLRKATAGIGEASDATELNAMCEKLGIDEHFRVQNSQHCRIVYRTGITDSAAAAALTMAERAILRFRARFVEPYLADDFVDRIPEKQFIQWHFGPDDLKVHEQLFEEYYGLSWGIRRAERLKMSGSRSSLVDETPRAFYYWRIDQDNQILGQVANNMGVVLASYHYRTNASRIPMDWVEEACGYWVSLEFLGRNLVQNKGFDWGENEDETVSRGPAKKGDEKQEDDALVAEGERVLYLRLAQDEGRPFNELMRTELFDMERGDVAKAWAMFEFLTTQHPEKAQHFLRLITDTSLLGKEGPAKFRSTAEAMFGVQGKDVYRVIDALWADWAKVAAQQ